MQQRASGGWPCISTLQSMVNCISCEFNCFGIFSGKRTVQSKSLNAQNYSDIMSVMTGCNLSYLTSGPHGL